MIVSYKVWYQRDKNCVAELKEIRVPDVKRCELGSKGLSFWKEDPSVKHELMYFLRFDTCHQISILP